MKVEGKIEFSITERSADRVKAEMPVHQGILNPYGIVNAGALLWFADVCASVLVHGDREFTHGASGFPLGVSLNADFVGNQKDGVIFAVSEFIKRDRRMNVVQTTIHGQDRQLIANVTTKHLSAK